MDHRKLGNAGIAVSKIALGTMYFGSETSEEDAFAILDTFVEGGGNLIDTADVYVGGVSEEIIGRWFAARPSDITNRVVLASKARFGGPDVNAVGLSRRHLHRALNASLRRLGVETIDLYQLHASDMHTPVEETLSFLDDAVTWQNSLHRPIQLHGLATSTSNFHGEGNGRARSGDASAAIQPTLPRN